MTRKFDSTPPIYFYLDPYQVPVDNLPQNIGSGNVPNILYLLCKVEGAFGLYKPIFILKSLDFPVS
jgi:hypothetical protein